MIIKVLNGNMRRWGESKAILTALLSAILLTAVPSSAELKPGESEFDLDSFGHVYAPSDWRVTERQDDFVVMTSPQQTAQVRFEILAQSENLEKLLINLAREVGIPLYTRSVDKKWLKKAGVDRGAFVLGTVQLPEQENSLAADSNGTVLDSTLTQSVFPNEDSTRVRYWMIVAYRIGNRGYLLESYTDNPPAEVNILNRMQRSWRFTDKR